jgi:alpha-L-rhamnosidase
MLQHGATTIWELWNGDTADPAMNSHNHVMLVGDLCAWLHENLAGIKPDPERPGFKHVIMRPEPVGDLAEAAATHDSIHGAIASRWSRSGGTFRWEIALPPNTTATAYVPAESAASISEGGRPIAQSPGIEVLRREPGRVVVGLGSGRYEIEATMPK